MIKLINVLFIIFNIIFCSKKDCDYIDRDLERFSKQEMTQAKWEELNNIIKKRIEHCKALESELNQPCLVQKKLYNLNPDIIIFQNFCSIDTKSERVTTTKIYVENSGSMDGYIRGGMEFREVISNLLIKFKHSTQKSNTYFISDKIEFVDSLPEKYLKEFSLEPYSKYVRLKNMRSGSEINELFKLVLNDTIENEISIFVTDSIYSSGNNKDVINNLVISKNITMDLFLESIKKKNISTLILQYSSNFNGTYFDMKLKPHIINTKKPFYIFIFSDNLTMKNIVIKRLDDLVLNKNLTNFIFFNKENSLPSFYILHKTSRIGSFSISNKIDSTISDIQIDKNKEEEQRFGFSFLADLHDLKLDTLYIKDINNFEINEGCKITTIEDYNEDLIEKLDLVTINKIKESSKEKFIPSHLLSINCDSRISLMNEILIKIKSNLPTWVEESNIDSDISQESFTAFKTFGIKYLISGIFEAYNEVQKKDITTIKIKIKR